MTTVVTDHPTATVELWAMDEHRIGLKPVLRKQWAPKGERPIVTVQPRYQWQYLYAFVCPATGATFWLLIPFVSVTAANHAFADFARAVGAGPQKRIILLLDQAGWHVSAQVVIPEGIHLVFLPPRSPELQPAEHLWRLTDTVLANKHFATLADLTEAQVDRCRKLKDQPDVIRRATNFHWLPKIEPRSD